FERRGDRRRHHVRIRAWIEGHDLDRRVIHIGQRRDRQQPETDNTHQQQAHHQKGGGDRPEDKRARGAHWPGARTATFMPCCSLSSPSVTTTSPCTRPCRTAAWSPSVSATTIGRISTVLSGFTRYTNVD